MTENEMVGWHYQLSGREFEQAPGDDEGQRSLHAAVHGVTRRQTRLSNNKMLATRLIILHTSSRVNFTMILWKRLLFLFIDEKNQGSRDLPSSFNYPKRQGKR